MIISAAVSSQDGYTELIIANEYGDKITLQHSDDEKDIDIETRHAEDGGDLRMYLTVKLLKEFLAKIEKGTNA